VSGNRVAAAAMAAGWRFEERTAKRRVPVLLLVVAVVLLGALAIGRPILGTAAQDAPSGAVHPLVGTWLLTFPDEPGAGPSLNSYTADGIAFQTDPLRGDAQGAWEATGERTAVMNLLWVFYDGDVFQGTGRVRATFEVDATGDAFVGTFTDEFVAADGISQGENGPFPVEGARVRAEPPSTGATPPATPAP
jgi:hypothetical protein